MKTLPRTAHAPRASWRFVFSFLLTTLTLSLSLPAAADPICARVKIEIKQELSLERQGFDAMMKITNGLDTTALENVNINVSFADESGNSVRATSDTNDTTAAFFIRVDTLDGITNVTGTGTVAPASVAEIHWLIVPAPGSGGTAPAGKLYYVGATLSYSVAGKAESVTVTPDFIYVKPMPLLNLDYFLTQDVFGDDPLTVPVEPIEPYTLGVRIKNTGSAAAKNVKIDSAQPKIVENLQGLLINFQIIGSYLNDLQATPSLLIPFGDIPANGAGNGRWLMTSSLMGKFVEFSATFSHADELGGALTSLIPQDGIKTHFLIRDVKVDLPGRDNVRDFLAFDGNVLRVYESSGLDTPVTDQSLLSTLAQMGTSPTGEILYALSTPATAGAMYVKFSDPYSGAKALGKVTRADGKTISPENVWLSKQRNYANNVISYHLNLFDTNTSGVYNVALANPANTPRPPTIQFITDKTVTEGQQVSFLVEASDPDGTVPTISSSLLPAGARLTAQPSSGLLARSIFDWTPGTGSSGRYPITFTASDGALTISTTSIITVGTPIPPAGPDTPVISAPQIATEVAVLEPELFVTSSGNPLDTATSYHFQVYADAGFQNLVAERQNVARGLSTTFWKVSVVLADNTPYYWRARAFDGTVYSPWAVGRFFVNTANDAPSVPGLATPANGTTVASTTPTLSLTNSVDADGELVLYGVEVYADSTLTQSVAQIAGLPAGVNGATSWIVTPALTDTTLYYWRATATDPHGAKTVSAVGNFLVDTTKPAPGAPALVAPAAGSTVSTASVDLTVANSLRPSGMNVSYFFEIDRVPTFTGPDIIRSGAVVEGSGNTRFTVTGLVENARYYWRAKVSDGLTESGWLYGDFFVDTLNDAPSIPAALNPGDNAWVTTLRPLFEFGLAVDPEADSIAYRIQIYSDVALTTLVAERLTNGLTWLTDVALIDDTRYYWRVRAEDLRGGASAWSPTATFLVRVGSSSPTTPRLALTAPAEVVTVTGPSVTLTWEIDDPEHNSTVSLAYDTDNQGADGTRIIDGLPQDASSRIGSYTWNVSALAPGTYYIYAVATNRAGSVTRYAPGAFVIPVPQPRGVVTVTPVTNPLETTEAGGIASFNVVLGNSPKSDVTVDLSVTHPGEAQINKPRLVFNTSNWSSPQLVRLTGLPDCVNDGDVAYQMISGRSESADADYNGIKGADLSLINRHSTVGCPTNNPPTANAGPEQTVNAGSVVALNGSGTDSDGAIASYAWVQTAGPNVILTNPNSAAASFTAPAPAAITTLTFQLTVTDNQGATGSASVNVIVRPAPNQAPTANAGPNQTVATGVTVTLAGSGTDSDGTIASYAWTQIAGSPVTLNNANTATANFVVPTVPVGTVFGFQLTVTDNAGALGTATVSITVAANQAPTANAGPDQTVNEGAAVTLTGSGTDSDGTIASYVWVQTAGTPVTLVNANTAVASFTAPQVTANTVLTFQITVTDNNGATGSATVNVTVNDVPVGNVPPTANAGAAQTVNEGAVATLSGAGTDTDGTIASYVWTQTAGPAATLANANTATATFTAPQVTADTVLTFQLTVTDNQGATGNATTNVTVANVNQVPVANAGTNQTVNEGAAVTLTGSGTDSDGTIASYAWTQTAGPAVTLTNANSATATFTAPAVTADTVLTFHLTVTDNQGATGTATTNVTVANVNAPPTANAGVAQTVNEGAAVTLTGTGTDSDGTIASYAWTQTAGPVVTLANANTAVASFTAPQVTANTVLTFQLTVTDNQGATGTATTNVTVANVNALPVANAGPNQTVNEGAAVTLAGTGTDSDGTIASYAWVQISGPTVTLLGANTSTASFTAPQVSANTVLTFQLTVTDNNGASGSATANVTVANVNQPPTANAVPAQTVNEGAAVTLTGSGSDPDGTIASYVWTQTAGPTVTLTNANTASASFTAPQVSTSTVFSFLLTVTDNSGATGSATTNVTVNNVSVSGRDLIVLSVIPSSLQVSPGQTFSVTNTVKNQGTTDVTSSFNVRLYGSLDATITTGDVVLVTRSVASLAAGATNTATVTATLPTNFPPGTYYIGAIVDHNNAISESNENNNALAGPAVTVVAANQPPTANAGTDQTVVQGTTVTLTGSGTDSGGSIASYVWTQTAGPTVTLTNANAAVASFTAPSVSTNTTLTFRLTVTDNQGATGSDTVNITVSNGTVNQPPAANAGPAQTANEGAAVTLSGSGTDSDGTIASYAWIQTAGPTATLANANTATASFTAPQVSASTVLSFQLTVTDNQGATGSASVNITVNNVSVSGRDLIVLGVTPSLLQVAPGQTFTVTNTVKNQGTSNVTSSFNVRLYRSTDASITTGDTTLATRSISSLNAGATNTATTTVTMPSGTTPGTYYLGVIVDHNNNISESNENNNALAGPAVNVGLLP